jgi:YD repeat-containing protein
MSESKEFITENITSITLSKMKFMIPSSVLCIKDGIILQLYYDSNSFRSEETREWRSLKSFEEASKEYNCNIVVGE